MKLILSHLRPREEFNGRSLGYFIWMKGWLAKPCQQGHIWTTGTIRIRDLTTARTPLSFISALLSILALFALYWQSDIFHMVNIMVMDSSHPQGGTNTYFLPGLKYRIWRSCLDWSLGQMLIPEPVNSGPANVSCKNGFIFF